LKNKLGYGFCLKLQPFMSLRKILQSLVLFLSLPSVAFALELTPEALLANVVKGFSTQTYTASAVYIRPSGMEAVDIKYSRGLEMQTLNADSEKQIVITKGKGTRLVQTAEKSTFHEGITYINPLVHLHQNLETGLVAYDLFISEQYDQVAGRLATRLSVISKTSDRYSSIYWVDKETHIILRTDTLNESGELIERMVFTAFSLKDDIALSAENNGSAKAYLYKKGSSKWLSLIKTAPLHFQLLSTQSSYDAEGTLSYERALLTDGFSMIDIYLGTNNHEAKITRGQQLDAFHVYKVTNNNQKISIEGNVPYKMLKELAAVLVGKND